MDIDGRRKPHCVRIYNKSTILSSVDRSLVIRNQVTMAAAIMEVSLEVLYILSNLGQFGYGRGVAMTELSDLQYGSQ